MDGDDKINKKNANKIKTKNGKKMRRKHTHMSNLEHEQKHKRNVRRKQDGKNN